MPKSILKFAILYLFFSLTEIPGIGCIRSTGMHGNYC